MFFCKPSWIDEPQVSILDGWHMMARMTNEEPTNPQWFSGISGISGQRFHSELENHHTSRGKTHELSIAILTSPKDTS